MKTKIKAVIEKGTDGQYYIYSEEHFGNSYFGGFGNSVSAAKADFVASIKEAINEETEENHKVPSFNDIKIEYQYDIPSFFNFFDFINVSKFASYVGINESKMRAYKSGVSYPSEKTTTKIITAIQNIGDEFKTATL